MSQQSELPVHTMARSLLTSSLPLWTPHQLPTIEMFNHTPAALQLSTPCSLLRVHQHSSSESIEAQHDSAKFSVAEVVAEWSSFPTYVAALSDDSDNSFQPRGSSRSEVLGRCLAPPLHVKSLNTYVVLKVDGMSHSPSATETQVLGLVDDGGCRVCRRGSNGRLKLSTVLYASDWQFLISQQKQNTAAAEGSLPLDATGTASEQTSTADMEALSTFFPAVHNRCYYATADAFVKHCRQSDEHLLWCEKDPLVSVEWADSEAIPTKLRVCSGSGSPKTCALSSAPGECAAVMASDTVGRQLSRISGSRKRRHQWLSERSREERSARGLQGASPCSMHPHSKRIDTISSSSRSTPDTNFTGLDSINCAYLLTVKLPHDCIRVNEEDSVSRTAATTAGTHGQRNDPGNILPSPLETSTKQIREILQSPSFTRWYSALRSACRCALHVSHSLGAAVVVKGGGRQLNGIEIRHRALQEVFLHGVTASLALWFLGNHRSSGLGNVEAGAGQGRESSRIPFSASAGDTSILVAALVRDWWEQLSGEATQSYLMSSIAATAPPQSHTNRPLAAYQTWAFLKQSSGLGDSTYTASSPPGPPSLLRDLCVYCAVVVTSIHRREERMLWWYVSSPALKHSQGFDGVATHGSTSDAACTTPNDRSDPVAADDADTDQIQSADGSTSTTLSTSASCRLPRLSLEESRRWRSNYRECMDLVLQLLFAEQQRHWVS